MSGCSLQPGERQGFVLSASATSEQVQGACLQESQANNGKQAAHVVDLPQNLSLGVAFRTSVIVREIDQGKTNACDAIVDPDKVQFAAFSLSRVTQLHLQGNPSNPSPRRSRCQKLTIEEIWSKDNHEGGEQGQAVSSMFDGYLKRMYQP